jgi:MFS transporter, DHA2 family, multidrug resistance protein
MSSALAVPATTGRAANPWLVAVTVTLATFMEVLDTSIANVSLPYIAGDLGVSQDESSWMLTTYLVANAIVLPISGWLSGLIGRKRFYMSCVVLFTVSSALCGMAPSLELLLLFRVLQGAGGGGLQPSEQSILLDTFPAAKRGMAMAFYGIAVLVAPILGPTLGGYLTENYSWRLNFYINIPVGIVSLLMTSAFVVDPPYLERARAQRRGWSLDYIGLGLITLGLGALEIVYDRGQIDDWFHSRFILVLSLIAGGCLVTLVFWELHHPNPIINLRLLRDRNFGVGCVLMFVTFAVLYGSNILLPQMLQSLYGYDAYLAGLMMSPGGVVVMLGTPIAGYLLNRGWDARWLIAAGLASIAVFTYWNTTLNLQVSPSIIVAHRCAQVVGMALVFAPINTAAYQYIPEAQHNQATSIFNMVRNEGASLGIALVTTLAERRQQFHQTRLAEHFTPFNPTFANAWAAVSDLLHMKGFDEASAKQIALAKLTKSLQGQALSLSYFDLFWLFAIATAVVIPLIFFMRRSVAERGAVGLH